MSQKNPTQASTAVKHLAEGDVIRVPQYKNALKVNYTGELNGEPNAFIGLEFVENKTGTAKTMVVNRNSGRVYLQAGTTDKGEVETIEVVSSATSDVDEADDEELTGADSPPIGENLDERTHYAHTRYAASDSPGVVWYDPRDGREKYVLENSDDDLEELGDELLTGVKLHPLRPEGYGDPAARYFVEQSITRLEDWNEGLSWAEEHIAPAHYGRTEVFESLEAARQWCRDNVPGYEAAPRRDAVRERITTADQ